MDEMLEEAAVAETLTFFKASCAFSQATVWSSRGVVTSALAFWGGIGIPEIQLLSDSGTQGYLKNVYNIININLRNPLYIIFFILLK